ncbi:MAG TPA: type II secretion system protein [Patescibacteria group bacterium]
MKTKKAFTLIELLIVIAIIGILSGVILVSTSSSSQKAKEAKYLAYITQATKMVHNANALGAFKNVDTGSPSAWKVLGDYGTTSCWGGSYVHDAAVDAALTSVTNPLPKGELYPGDANHCMLISVSGGFANVLTYAPGVNDKFCPPGGAPITNPPGYTFDCVLKISTN